MENNSHHQNMNSSSSGIDNHMEIQVGYRFRPTDHELITKYLMKKINNQLCVPYDNIDIQDAKLYDHNPWDLTKKYDAERENWYFFNSRKRKYPNGQRPDRAAGGGYWKPTGVDKSIKEEDGTKEIGYKKSLDFYLGKHPHGTKTDWKMHEYRLAIKGAPQDSMTLNEWVISRIYKKRDSNRDRSISNDYDDEAMPVSDRLLRHNSLEAESLNLEGEAPQQNLPSSDILIEVPNNPTGYLEDAILLWRRNNHGYDCNNQTTTMLSTHEVQPNIFIFNDCHLNDANLFGSEEFLEDVVHGPWKNTVPEKNTH